jgi:hypothetical protein
MYAVVNHLHFNKPVDEFRTGVANEGLPLLQSLRPDLVCEELCPLPGQRTTTQQR